MYAIVEAGGRQWRVEPGTRLAVNRVAAEVGAQHALTRVLMAQDGTELKIGRPYLEGAQVVCEVLDHPRGPKVISYHYRRRENWRKTVGHRQPLTRLLVKDIQLAGGAAVVAPMKESAKPAAPAKRLASAKGAARPAAAAKPKRGTRHGA